MNSIDLSIGNILVRVNGLSDKLFNDAVVRYGVFIVKSGQREPDAVINLEILKRFISDKPLEPELSHEGEILRIRRYDFEGNYHMNKRILNIGIFENIFSLDAVLRIYYSYYTALNKGFLIHSAGIVVDDEVFVFCGETLHGKSHIIKNTKKGILLSDEVTLIRKVDDEYFVFGTPFWGEFAVGGENLGFPLSSLYFLHKGEEIAVQNFPDMSSVQKLLSTILLFINDKKSNDIIFDTITDIIKRVNCYKLIYNQKDDIWRELKYARNAEENAKNRG